MKTLHNQSANLLGERSRNDMIAEWDLNNIQLKYLRIVREKLATGKYTTEDVRVCLCGGASFQRISDKDRFGLPFGNSICVDCGIIHCTPRLKASHLPDFYDHDYHGLVFGSELIAEYEHMVSRDQGIQIYNFLKSHLQGNRTYRVAEIGAGVGNNLIQIIESAGKDEIQIEATGSEYSKACVEYGIKHYNLNLVQGGVSELLRENSKYDLVILSHVLEHFSAPLEELGKIRDLLTDDGMVYVEVPGVLDLHNKPVYRCDYLRYQVLAHMYNFSLGTLSNTMRLAGYELLTGTEFVRSIYALGGHRKPEILNHHSRIVEYLETLDKQKRLFYEFNLAKADLSRALVSIATTRKVLEDRVKWLPGEISDRVRATPDPELKKASETLSTLAEGVSTISTTVSRFRQDLGEDVKEAGRATTEALRRSTIDIIEVIEKNFALVEEKESTMRELSSRHDSLVSKYQALETECSVARAAVTHTQAELNVLTKELEFLRLEYARQRAEKHRIDLDYGAKLASLQAEKARQETQSRKEILDLATNLELVKRQLSVIVNSLSWKLTFPIRKIKEILIPGWKG